MSQSQEERKAISLEPPTIPKFRIPEKVDSWQVLCQNGGLQGLTIHDVGTEHLGSGAKVGQKQYCLLRVLWPIVMLPMEFENERLSHGLEEVWDQAGNITAASEELQRYLSIVEDDIPIQTLTEFSENWPGSFKPVRTMQEHTKIVGGVSDRERPTMQPRAKRSRLRGIKSTLHLGKRALETMAMATDVPEAEDEATPNAAIILYLQSLSGLVPGVDVDWVLNRFHFAPNFRHGRYNAHTDGALRARGSGALIAIVETKKRGRFYKDSDSIRMQEAAEVVGWLLKEPGERSTFMNNQ